MPTRFLVTAIALRTGTAFRRPVDTDVAGAVEVTTLASARPGTKALPPSEGTSRRCRSRPGAKPRKGNAIMRCASQESRAACQGKMNHKNIVILRPPVTNPTAIAPLLKEKVARLDMVPPNALPDSKEEWRQVVATPLACLQIETPNQVSVAVRPGRDAELVVYEHVVPTGPSPTSVPAVERNRASAAFPRGIAFPSWPAHRRAAPRTQSAWRQQRRRRELCEAFDRSFLRRAQPRRPMRPINQPAQSATTATV